MFRRASSEPVDPTWTGVYRAGGVAMIATGVLYYLFIVLGSMIGPAPGSGDDYYNGLATHIAVAQTLFWAFSLSDFLLLVGVLALFFALKGVRKNALVIGAALVLVYLVYDLAVTETTSLTLVALIQQSAAATTDAQRAAVAAAADYARATLPFATFVSWVLGCVGWFIVNLVMLKGPFFRAVPALGIAFSIEGILGGCYIFSPALAALMNPALATFGIWSIFVGIRLIRLSRQATAGVRAETRTRAPSL